ncbi:MAG: response regulator [Anaerolineaceae bacterium]|nr:response regulator [Anaerolineaceae bacterium]
MHDCKPTTAVSPRILIVDDHPHTASTLARALTKFETSVDVFTASSAEDALILIDANTVDILITDFIMPGLSGLDLIERLKGEKRPAYIILITAYDTPGLALTAKRLNIDEYLVKPVQTERIFELVADALTRLRLPEADKTYVQNAAKSYPKILIADDNPDNIRLLSVRLQNEGYLFISARDGEETLAKIRSEKPDLVLLDINMPKKDGFEVLAELRTDPDIAHIPVIAVTAARVGSQDIVEGLNYGADDYITKPIDWRELAAHIRSKLRVKQAGDALRKDNRQIRLDTETRYSKKLGAFQIICQQIDGLKDPDQFYKQVPDLIHDLLEYPLVSYWKVAPSVNKNVSLLLCHLAGDEKELEPGCFTQAADRVLLVGNTVCLPAVEEKMHRQDDGIDAIGTNMIEEEKASSSSIAVPVLFGEHISGVLAICSRKARYFTKSDRIILEMIAAELGGMLVRNVQRILLEKHGLSASSFFE